MPLDQILKLLSAARFPLAVGFFGLVLNIGGSNLFLKNTGATVGLLATGCAVATATRKEGNLREVQRLTEAHSHRETALQASIASALADVATAQQEAQQQAQNRATSEGQAKGAIAHLTAERDRMRQEVLSMGAQINAASIALNTSRDDNSGLAGELESLQVERMQLIYELYETAVTEADLGSAITSLETQFQSAQGDTAYQLTQKKKLKSAVTQARADFHTQITDAHSRIAELESELAQKTKLAEDMIAELDRINGGQLNHFSGKASAQSELIKSLQIQLDEQRKTTHALERRRFDPVGTDNIMGNRLIDALAKHGSTYGAFDKDREGHNGRLKVWLTMVDAPLSRAKDALEDLEAELKLFAKPTVEVSKGMHLFTLAVEQEHKVLAAPNVPLTRLERTLDAAIHARIVGGSGSGKTVLLSNLMHYLAASMDGANVTLLDPKAVDDWGSFTPRYWGEECVTGITELADSLKGRVADTVSHRKAGRPAPEYDPELFVLDEAQYNYLLAQNADDSHVKERGETPPNFAKKAKGALAGLLSLGRAYNAIGLFVTQLPQVSKVGLNEGSFDPCVNIFLGVQIDNAIDSFLPGSGFTDAKCKALDKELATRRKLGQEWLMLVADLPRSEAYLMECPAPGYYHNRFSGNLGGSTKTAKPVAKRQSTASTAIEPGNGLAGVEPLPATCQPATAAATTVKQPSAHCPDCSHKSIKTHGSKPQPNGKFRFICENSDCAKGTFRALPLA